MNVKVVIFSIFFWVLLVPEGNAQNTINEGEVTFTTSANVYVRFESTKNIEIGDTLYRREGEQIMPCMVVSQKSSNSTVNKSIGDCKLKSGDVIFFMKDIFIEEEEIEDVPIIEEPLERPLAEEELNSPTELPLFQERIRARMSFASYSNMSSRGDKDRHRIMLRGNINARNINNGKLSFESYVNYGQNIFQPGANPNSETKFLRLYNLALTYDVNESMQFSLGRKINRKVSSIGAIDGLQVEKYFGNFFVGAIGGFKPDLFKFDFNSELLQYGGYIGLVSNDRKLYSQTTLGLLEQRNGAAVDRRYAYFQHSSTLNRKLTIFGSAEVDLYQNLNGVESTQPRLTNLYASARYRFSRAISLTVSYDTRKRIIYYETLRTDVEKLLADDQARQGLRTRLNVRPFKFLSFGASFSRRFQNNRQNQSDNINGFISYSKLPFVKGRLAINVNQNESNYQRTRILSGRYSRSIIRKKLSADFYYRKVEYNYIGNESRTTQDYFGASFNIRLTKKLSLSLLGEFARRSNEENYRFNTRLIKRF